MITPNKRYLIMTFVHSDVSTVQVPPVTKNTIDLDLLTGRQSIISVTLKT
jgi:hypothetical protein